ncbi:TRAP transporter large permease [Chloroflexota bacterium]
MEIPFGMLVGALVFLVALGAGIPVCWSFLASSLVALALMDSPAGFITATFYGAIDNYIMMAIAFFILAGALMAEAGVADAIIRLAHALVGKIKGGLAAVGVLATLFISSLTGSSVPCIATLIPLLVPRMEKLGYERRYSTAILCSSSFMGYLIPPSIPVLIYCLVARQSVAAVFLATVIPGLLLAASYLLINYFVSSRYMHPTSEVDALPTTLKGSVKKVGIATWLALPALGCPLIILGGIYGGIFTPNEAGAVAVLYTVIIGLFVYREMKLKTMLACTKNAAGTLGMVTLLLGFGMIFARLMVREGIAEVVSESFIGVFGEKYLILLMLNLLLLIMGMFIDGIPILIIVVPLLMPLVEVIDVNLVHLGAIIVVNVGIGVVTPPYAISIFVGSRLSGVPYAQLVKPMMLFLLIGCLPVLFLTTYFPVLSCWLPSLVVGAKIVGPW